MPTSTTAKALELLPAGGTRLGRAFLKHEVEACLDWIEAGSDPWARMPLPDTVRAHIWGRHQDRRAGKPVWVVNGPDQLPVVALAVALATDQTWPAVEALLRKTDLSQDAAGWVFEAALRSKAPPTEEERRWASFERKPLPPARPDALWATLLEQGLRPPAKDYLPSLSASPPKESIFLALPTAWREAMEAHLGSSTLFAAFEPGHSPLDRRPGFFFPWQASERGANLTDTWLRWLKQGMPMAQPQASLLHLTTTPLPMTTPAFDELVQALVARGARLDAITAGPHGPGMTAAGAAIDAHQTERARRLQALQGRTLSDPAGAPGTPTAIVEAAWKIVEERGPWLRSDTFHRLKEEGVELDALANGAMGWRQMVGQLQPVHSERFPDLIRPFHHWRQLAQAVGISESGREQGGRISALEQFMDRTVQLALQAHMLPAYQGEPALVKEWQAWAAYAEHPLEALAQHQLHRITAQHQLKGALIWAPQLTQLGASLDTPGPNGRTPRQQARDDFSGLESFPAHQVHTAFQRLADLGVHPWMPDALGQTPWNRLSLEQQRQVLADEELIKIQPATTSWSDPFRELTQRLTTQLEKAELTAWISPPPPSAGPFRTHRYLSGPFTVIERLGTIDSTLQDHLPQGLGELRGLDRAQALVPFIEQVLRQGLVPANLAVPMAELPSFIKSQQRAFTLAAQPAQPPRPRRRI